MTRAVSSTSRCNATGTRLGYDLLDDVSCQNGRSEMENWSRLLASCCAVTAAVLLSNAARPESLAAQAVPIPQFKVDPYWPKPLPQVKGADGQMRRWMTGQVAAVCIDSHDHIITTNRGGRLG